MPLYKVNYVWYDDTSIMKETKYYFEESDSPETIKEENKERNECLPFGAGERSIISIIEVKNPKYLRALFSVCKSDGNPYSYDPNYELLVNLCYEEGMK